MAWEQKHRLWPTPEHGVVSEESMSVTHNHQLITPAGKLPQFMVFRSAIWRLDIKTESESGTTMTRSIIKYTIKFWSIYRKGRLSEVFKRKRASTLIFMVGLGDGRKKETRNFVVIKSRSISNQEMNCKWSFLHHKTKTTTTDQIINLSLGFY